MQVAMTPQKSFIIRSVIALACLGFFACGISGVNFRAAADEFQPVRKRLTYSTETGPIDIEVVGSTSLVPQFHKLIPELVLRLRLARAYVDLWAEREPGFEILSLVLDFETALPMAYFDAVTAEPRFRKEIPGIPKLLPDEGRHRNIVLHIESDARVEGFRKYSEGLSSCHGDTVENGMWAYERKKDCFGLGYRRFGKVAELDDGSFIEMECDDEARPSSFARCQTRFPFKGFIVGLNFHRDLLPRWREVIRFSEDFLKSKQYPQQEAH